MTEDAHYRLQPQADAFPRGTLTVRMLDGRAEGRLQYACAIAWRETEEARPHIVFDEIVRSGVGDEPELDTIAATALGFATYTEGSEDAYSCEPVDEWAPWVEIHGEDVGNLRYDGPRDDPHPGESLAHLRV